MAFTWGVGGIPVLGVGAPGAWDSGEIYRSTFLPTDTGFDLWYNGISGRLRHWSMADRAHLDHTQLGNLLASCRCHGRWQMVLKDYRS